MSAISARNVLRVYRTATPDQVEAGMIWYAEALELSTNLAGAYGISTDQAVAIVAALSPMKSWGANVVCAVSFLSTGEGKTYGANVRKCEIILAGMVTPFEALGGNKVKAFYESITAAGLTDEVCIDRHAHDVMTNQRNVAKVKRPPLTDAQYAQGVAAYRRAAAIASAEAGYTITPAQMQAITWVTWRSRYWSEGAWDVK